MGERVDPEELSSNLLALPEELSSSLLPEELSSNLCPEGCATNVDSTWSQGLDLAPAFGGMPRSLAMPPAPAILRPRTQG